MLDVSVKNGRVVNGANELKEYVRGLDDGNYIVLPFKAENKTTHTRYAYYYDAFLPDILSKIRGRLFIRKGCVVRSVDNPRLLHDFIKFKFNFIELVTEDGMSIRLPDTTKSMTDTDFIGRFEEEIAAYFAQEYGIEIISFDDYVRMKRKGNWHSYKENLK